MTLRMPPLKGAEILYFIKHMKAPAAKSGVHHCRDSVKSTFVTNASEVYKPNVIRKITSYVYLV